MSKVRAKFVVKQIINHLNGDPTADQAGEAVLGTVYDEAYKDWSKWKPQGKIKMTITNPSARDAFELGEQYFVDFSLA